MPDREKVIKGLECCVRHFGDCENCSYDEGRGNCGCGKQLYADAIALLTAQEARQRYQKCKTYQKSKAATEMEQFIAKAVAEAKGKWMHEH